MTRQEVAESNPPNALKEFTQVKWQLKGQFFLTAIMWILQHNSDLGVEISHAQKAAHSVRATAVP
jgi:hypothetical protein